jgi:hypothetical protein
VLQTSNIHIAVCREGEVTKTLATLKAPSDCQGHKAKFVLAVDGVDLEAEDLVSGETVACLLSRLPQSFWLFPAAGRDQYGKADPLLQGNGPVCILHDVSKRGALDAVC